MKCVKVISYVNLTFSGWRKSPRASRSDAAALDVNLTVQSSRPAAGAPKLHGKLEALVHRMWSVESHVDR